MSWLDSLYFQGKILELLTKKEDFDNFLIDKKISKKYLRGYLYLIEVTINALIECIESLIPNDNVYDLINYQNITLKDIPKKYRDSSQELNFIRRLEKIRKEIAKLRNSGDNNINEKLNNLDKLVNEISNYFLSEKRVKINNKNKEKENLYFIVELTNKQNYIKTVLLKDQQEPVPIYPVCNYYNLGYKKIHEEYNLQNPKIKKFNKEYIAGYCLGLAFLYNRLEVVPKHLINKLLTCRNWNDLHNIGSNIYNKIIKNENLNIIGSSIYEDMKTSENRKLQKLEIDETDLKYLFRDRRIFIIEPKEKYYPNEFFPLFISLVFGIKSSSGKPEVVELKVKENDKFWYSYAVFIYYGCLFANASYWVLFKDMAFEEGNYKTDEKKQIDNFFNKNNLTFHKYSVDQKILEKYCSEHDPNYGINRKLKTMLKWSNSLLVELLALFYITKQFKEKIIDIEWEVDVKDTEADLIVYFDKKVLIIQAQTNLYKSSEELINHFEKVKEFLKKNKADKIENKTIEKIAFTYFKDSCEEKTIKKLEKNAIKLVSFEDLNLKGLDEQIKNKLSSCLMKRFK